MDSYESSEILWEQAVEVLNEDLKERFTYSADYWVSLTIEYTPHVNVLKLLKHIGWTD